MKTKRRQWTVFEISMLGRHYDIKHARRFRRTFHEVWRKRNALQIPACRKAQTRIWTTAEDGLLGTASDSVVAAQLGRSFASVAHHRRQLKIPPAARV